MGMHGGFNAGRSGEPIGWWGDEEGAWEKENKIEEGEYEECPHNRGLLIDQNGA